MSTGAAILLVVAALAAGVGAWLLVRWARSQGAHDADARVVSGEIEEKGKAAMAVAVAMDDDEAAETMRRNLEARRRAITPRNGI